MTSGNDWELYRLDDNGNRFLVQTYPTRELAEQAKESFEKKGHKQTYLIINPKA